MRSLYKVKVGQTSARHHAAAYAIHLYIRQISAYSANKYIPYIFLKYFKYIVVIVALVSASSNARVSRSLVNYVIRAW
jgi:ABC-type uncharacterized transport system permease subunit